MTSDTGVQIIDKAKEMGASMAGIANVELLKKSPSHEIIKKLGMEIDGVSFGLEMTDFNEIKWPEKAKSALVIAVSHPRDKPELDWWDAFNSSPGNRTLVRINRELSEWIEETLRMFQQVQVYDSGGY